MGQREIKFRCWDIKEKRIFIPDGLKNPVNFTDNIIHMQFCGLHDKNGKDIYESDLVKSSKNIYEVVWNTECARWGLLKSNGKFPVAIHHGAKTLEVIGNVFENKELLK